MSDLNLNFDTGAKSISVTNTSTSGNLGFQADSNPSSPIKTIELTSPPNLSVTDPGGMGLLIGQPGAGVMNSPKSDNDSVKSDNSVKEDFSFFKSFLKFYQSSKRFWQLEFTENFNIRNYSN